MTRERGQRRTFRPRRLSFLHAEQTGKQDYYLAAAIYAYSLLFPSGAAEPLYPIDRRLRVAADLYNRGLTSGFASADRSVVELRSGTRTLPFGELTVEFDPKWLRWGDRRLVNFVPVTELEVRGCVSATGEPESAPLWLRARRLLYPTPSCGFRRQRDQGTGDRFPSPR